MRDWQAWQQAIARLSLVELGEVRHALGSVADQVPHPDKVEPAAIALKIVQLMQVRPDLEEAVGAELQRLNRLPEPLKADRWLQIQAAQHRTVPIVGMKGEEYRLPIGQIYVPLHFVDQGAWREDRGDGPVERAASGEVTMEEALRELQRRREEDDAQLMGVSVVGAPGAGKTTLLKRLFTQLRDGKDAGLPPGLVPVYLRMSACYRAVLSDVGAPRCSLAGLLEAAAVRDVPGAGHALTVRRTPLLVLLDGLDEVPDEDTRVTVARWLGREVARWPGSTFVVTCRTAAWSRSDDELRATFLPLSVLGFERAAIETYIGMWFPLVVRHYHAWKQSQDAARLHAEQQAKLLVETLFAVQHGASWGLVQMARNPLLLSVICLVQFKRGQLPDTRAQLYEECLVILIEAIHREGEVRPLPARTILSTLQPVAWHMQTLRQGGDQDATAIAEKELLTVLTQQAQLGLEVGQLLALLADNGVLVSPDVGRWRFAHLTFQEYLAARHANACNLEEDLAVHMADPMWQETLLLAMAQPGFFARFLVPALQREPSAEALELLVSCQAEGEPCGAAPLARILEAAVARRPFWVGVREHFGLVSPDPPLWRVRAALQLARRGGVQGLEFQARQLTAHSDSQIAHLARELAGMDGPSSPVETPQPGRRYSFKVANIGIEAVWVPAGTFFMGSSRKYGETGYDPEAYQDEEPRHEVTIARGFWLGRFPVTNQQYRVYLGDEALEPVSFRDSSFNGHNQPVVGVSWHEAMAYCRWVSSQLGGVEADLPTESEWEWAARGRDGRRFPWGNESPEHGWAQFNARATAPVGIQPLGRGPFGAEDQAGNVWEWCKSAFRAYRKEPRTDDCFLNEREALDPDNPYRKGRALRGGSWSTNASYLRATCRLGFESERRTRNIGFRLVFRPSPLVVGVGEGNGP